MLNLLFQRIKFKVPILIFKNLYLQCVLRILLALTYGRDIDTNLHGVGSGATAVSLEHIHIPNIKISGGLIKWITKFG